MKSRATGSDVARLAGVSKSAVSRAFTGGLVSDDARMRIFEAARNLKYRPSNTARSLTTQRSRMIGIAVTHLDNQYYPEIIEKLSDRLARDGYRLLLFVTHGETDLDPMLDELLGYGVDGVILASSSLASRVAAECQEARIPVLMFNNLDPEGATPGISTDETAGAGLVARYLIAAGHQRFGVITGIANSTTSTKRLAGFNDAIREAGLEAPVVRSGRYTFEGAIAATHELLDGKDAPDALFCVNDHMALGALHALHDRHLRPGREVSLVGFDDVAISRWPLFSLTTLAQPVDRMVEAACSALLRAIAGHSIMDGPQMFAGRLVVRASARLAPGAVRTETGELVWTGDR